MHNNNKRVAILGGLRIPFVKSFQQYSRTSNQEMLTATLQGMVDKYGLSGKLLGDVALGAVMQSSFEWNYSREVVLGTTLHPNTPAFNLQRACGTSLEAINLIALKISAGQIESGIGGGSGDMTSFAECLRLIQSRTRSIGTKLTYNWHRSRGARRRVVKLKIGPVSRRLQVRARHVEPDPIMCQKHNLPIRKSLHQKVENWQSVGLVHADQEVI